MIGVAVPAKFTCSLHGISYLGFGPAPDPAILASECRSKRASLLEKCRVLWKCRQTKLVSKTQLVACRVLMIVENGNNTRDAGANGSA